MAYPRRKLQTKPRRRTQAKALFPRAAAAASLAMKGVELYNTAQQMKKEYNGMRGGNKKPPQKTVNRKPRSNYRANLFAADNITRVPPIVIGKQRVISFTEKVSRTLFPPLLFKRNYQFSAECGSGRKGWFSMEVNVFNNNDLSADMQNYKSQMRTDTTSSDSNLSVNSAHDGARFYVDYLNEKIQMINSSTNALTGKIHLIAHKRDNDNNYVSTSTPITPINLMMYYSTNSVPQLVAGAGGEGTAGNGWFFNTAVGSLNYTGVYNMPGSNINPGGYTAQTDLQLGLFSTHIKEKTGFWFKPVNTSSFSLKPGQQFNSSFIFNDLPLIHREQSDYVHVAGVSYSIVVEFQGQIVGDGTVTTGDGVVSTGSCQLSIIRENKRILGLENTLKSKVVLQTTQLAAIANAAQITINADSGVMDTGVELDT